MKKQLLVTLADQLFVKQAKQLFSSAYFNGAWDGEYMLMSRDIPKSDLEWFKEKGILIYDCGILGDYANSSSFFKMWLFTQTFRQWENILYLDADIIVASWIGRLKHVKGLWAVPDFENNTLCGQLIDSDNIEDIYFRDMLKKKVFQLGITYDLNKPSFNCGVLAFSTDIIRNDTLNSIKNIHMEYAGIFNPRYYEQPALNLYFYGRWRRLHSIYNMCASFSKPKCVKRATIIHFSGGANSPWLEESNFYKMWKDSLDKADCIDLKIPPKINSYIKIRPITDIIYSDIYDLLNRRVGILLRILRFLKDRIKKVCENRNKKLRNRSRSTSMKYILKKFVSILYYFGILDVINFMIYEIIPKMRPGANIKRTYSFYDSHSRPVYIRLNDTDAWNYSRIFIENEFQPLTDIKNVKTVVDCGGYIGLSSVWFLEHFKNARVIAIEPNEQVLPTCRNNLKFYRNRYVLIKAGLWSHNTGLIVERGLYRDGKEWSTQVREAREGEVPDIASIDMPSLISDFKIDAIDILKVDIERAEIAMFCSSHTEWLFKVKNIAIELHDDECEKIFFKALSPFKYELIKSGELTICKNIRSR